jgi:hypothetical protein
MMEHHDLETVLRRVLGPGSPVVGNEGHTHEGAPQ